MKDFHRLQIRHLFQIEEAEAPAHFAATSINLVCRFGQIFGHVESDRDGRTSFLPTRPTPADAAIYITRRIANGDRIREAIGPEPAKLRNFLPIATGPIIIRAGAAAQISEKKEAVIMKATLSATLNNTAIFEITEARANIAEPVFEFLPTLGNDALKARFTGKGPEDRVDVSPGQFFLNTEREFFLAIRTSALGGSIINAIEGSRFVLVETEASETLKTILVLHFLEPAVSQGLNYNYIIIKSGETRRSEAKGDSKARMFTSNINRP
ncbi:MAG: hypothetical protein LCH61_04160 [Proteobacteria bacterium]|nr:hypothetical protein [Pseudomonadota bacterium]